MSEAAMKLYADDEMLRNALGDDGVEEMQIPPYVTATKTHPLWKQVEAALREVYDPEIPVNVYELGLIYKVEINADTNDVYVEMSLTSPGCPVAGEMPVMVEDSVRTIADIGTVKVEIIWDPPWDPSKMAETAKLQLNMF